VFLLLLLHRQRWTAQYPESFFVSWGELAGGHHCAHHPGVWHWHAQALPGGACHITDGSTDGPFSCWGHRLWAHADISRFSVQFEAGPRADLVHRCCLCILMSGQQLCLVLHSSLQSLGCAYA
jgi:hypothetical protein